MPKSKKYIVTGATGFIGRYVVSNLLREGADVVAIVRKQSKEKNAKLEQSAADLPGNLTLVFGDINRNKVITSAKKRQSLKNNVDGLFHLAAIYDMANQDTQQYEQNVIGTRNVVHLANELGTTLHHVSSIAVAGDYKGNFHEDMFDEGQKHNHPYFSSKFESEKVVREECNVPWRVYRPGIVVGSSVDGQMDKIDGPYYFFKLIQNIRGLLPQWVPLVGLEGGKLQFAPVDYVADALVTIALKKGLDRQVFHLVDDTVYSVGDATNIFSRAAHAPEMAMRIDTRLFNVVPKGMRNLVSNLPMVNELQTQIADNLGIPPAMLGQATMRAKFDTANTRQALKKSGIECPDLESYAWKIWDYWERHLDPDLFIEQTLEARVRDKNVLITGASSGIGKSVALRVAEAGANTILMARTRENLEVVQQEIEAAGGKAYIYCCDLADDANIIDVAEQILGEHGHVDILVNNAGRSIRRTIEESVDRFHDFERTMQLNYFGALRLILKLLPGMRARHHGHIINISSIGVQTNAPRFSAYVASKSALDAFSRCIAAEVGPDGIALTTVLMPLVRTPMIAPTKIYEFFPALSPEEAADMVIEAIVKRPKRVATRLGTFAEAAYAISPKLVDSLQSMGYRLFPSSKPGEKQNLSVESVAFAHLMRGVHW